MDKGWSVGVGVTEAVNVGEADSVVCATLIAGSGSVRPEQEAIRMEVSKKAEKRI